MWMWARCFEQFFILSIILFFKQILLVIAAIFMLSLSSIYWNTNQFLQFIVTQMNFFYLLQHKWISSIYCNTNQLVSINRIYWVDSIIICYRSLPRWLESLCFKHVYLKFFWNKSRWWSFWNNWCFLALYGKP